MAGAVKLVGSNGDNVLEPLQQLRDIIVDAIYRNTSLAKGSAGKAKLNSLEFGTYQATPWQLDVNPWLERSFYCLQTMMKMNRKEDNPNRDPC